MAQKLVQTQTEKQVQVQRLSQQQMLQVRLLEMPLTELEESINAELDDNPALEASSSDDMSIDNGDVTDALTDGNEDDFEAQTEREERKDALDSALERIGQDDEMPAYNTSERSYQNADYEEIVYGDSVSFYDKLKEQMGEHELTARQRDIMEYLIGSLDDDGMLRKDIEAISDELAIYNNMDVSAQEIAPVLSILHDFDPAGIGAKDLQECLLLQIERRPESRLKELMQLVITKYFDEFKKKHWDKIKTSLHLDNAQADALQKEILKLNPKPGASLGETEGRNVQQITPDFIVDTADDGSVTFSLNYGNVPELYVSPSFVELVETYKQNKAGMTKQDKEALLYAKGKVDKAYGFIEAVKQRRNTMITTMRAIINWQRKFFVDGDESDIKPMVLKDIADKTGLDISTISRVSNVKYAQTKWGTFPLRFFFSDGYTTEDGEQMSTRKIKIALNELIAGEDKSKPMSDDALKEEMRKRGFPIARRTIAKYREQMDIPVARLRKEI